jgi:hypothetical protein
MSLSRSRFPRAAGLLAGAVLMFGALPGAWAQSFPTTMTFNGTGTLFMADAEYAGFADVPSSISLSGYGNNVATALNPADNFGFDEYVSSSFDSFNVNGNVTLSPTGNSANIYGPATIGLTENAYTTFPLISTTFNPYYTAKLGVVFYPPEPEPDTTNYTGNVANPASVSFYTDASATATIPFNPTRFQFSVGTGAGNLVLGSTFLQSGDSVTYYDSTFTLGTSVIWDDPDIVYTGDLTITSANLAPITPVPEPSGLMAGLVSLALCARSCWQERRAAKAARL